MQSRNESGVNGKTHHVMFQACDIPQVDTTCRRVGVRSHAYPIQTWVAMKEWNGKVKLKSFSLLQKVAVNEIDLF